MTILGNRFLAERIKNEKATTEGGIYLPAVALDDHNTGGPKTWRVLQVGPGKRLKDGTRIPLEFGPGDVVIAHSYTTGATETKDGKFILEADAVVVVIPSQT